LIKSVARHLKYSPETIDKLYADNIDYHGLIYWFKDAMDYANEINNAMNPKD
jgi:hypothetical protein